MAVINPSKRTNSNVNRVEKEASEVARESDGESDGESEQDNDEGRVVEADDGPPPEKRTRNVRKRTWWMFVERLDGVHVVCLCGCLSKDDSKRLEFSAPTNWTVKRHVATKHPLLATEFYRSQNSDGNSNRLE